jgi:hypothetical protein
MPFSEAPTLARRDPFSRRQARILAKSAAESLAAVLATGVEAYDRDRHLPRLIPIGPAELADQRPEARRAVLARLARALRAERNRGRAGHWTYDLNRHIGLKQAYEAERRLLSALALLKRGGLPQS